MEREVENTTRQERISFLGGNLLQDLLAVFGFLALVILNGLPLAGALGALLALCGTDAGLSRIILAVGVIGILALSVWLVRFELTVLDRRLSRRSRVQPNDAQIASTDGSDEKP